MTVNQRVTGRSMSIPAGIGLGVLISGMITLLGAAVIALLISSDKIPENGMGYGSMITLLTASFMGGWTAWGLIRHQRLLVCGIHCAGYLAFLLSLTALFFGGQYQGIGVTVLLVLAGDGAAALMTMNSSNSKKYRRRKIRSR